MPVRIDANPNADRVYNTTPAQPGQSNTRNIMSIAEFNKANPNNKWNSNVGAVIQTSSGKQYTLDKQTYDWITSRYKQDWADSYGLDDADQYAQRNGEMSAAVRNTYNTSGIDQDLMRLGLPSQKNLEKYLEGYQKWHTGGMDQYFSQMNLPKNYWTNVKGWYQSDMQNAYENTAEDQQRKARGLMPSKWESKYTDTEIDDQLRARGLPPISEFKTYADRWNNYTGIENFYANVALNETNLRLAGVKDDDTVYPYNGEEYKGKDLYAMAFFDELDKKNDDGSYVYAPIRSMFKNGAKPTTSAGTGDYAYDRGAAITAANKEEASDADYASYNAFSYDDYKSKYDDLYNRYFAGQTLSNGQTVNDALTVKAREENAEALRDYFKFGAKEPAKFTAQYFAEHPDATPETMFLDMEANNVTGAEAYEVYETMKKEAKGTSAWYDVVNGWSKTYGGVWSNVNESDAPIPDTAKPLTDEQRDAQAEKDRVKAAQDYSRAVMNGDRDALYYASERAKTLGYNNNEDMIETLKANKSDQFVQAVKDAIAVYDSAMAAYEDTYPGYGAPSPESREPIDKATAVLNALGFKSVHDATRYVGGAREADPQKFVRENTAAMNDYVDNAPAPSEEAVTTARNAIEAALIDDNGPMYSSVDAVIRVLDGIAENSANAAAYWQALEDLGFTDLSGMADDLTADWSDADKRKLKYHLGGNNFLEMTKGEDSANNDWSAVGSAQYSQQLNSDKFSRSLEWVLQQVNAGKMTEADGYQLLAANGFQNEMEEYMGDEWHKAHFIENTAPGLYAQAEETDRLLWEEMTPEEQRAAAEDLWNGLTDEQKSAMYGKDWWKFDPTVYRTFGQALEQQFQAVLPGLGAEIISTPVKVLDAIEANLSGRPEMWDTTQDLMAFQQKMGNLGAVADNVNGAGVAQTAADVVQEIGRMYFYGSIGGAIGAGFAGTSAGAAVMAGSASNSMAVRGASKMFMSMVKSSPFVVSAFANNYAEAKELGAPNNEATWFALITGLSEGILEGFEFDELWGKALGQGNFAKQLALGKHTYLQNLGIVGKAWVSSAAVSGLGEFTEESIGYVLETFLKMRHSDTWGKGTEWNASDWLQQAMMGFITGALGGGIAAGSSFVKDGVTLSKALRDNPSLQAALPDIITAYGEAKSMPDAALDAYRKGGATVLSRSAYGQLITEIENNNKGIENYENTIRSIETKRQKAIGDAKLEVDKLASKIAPYESDSPETAPTLPGEVANKEYAPLKAKLEAAKQHLDYVTNNMDPEEARQLKEAKSKLQNSLVQKESLAKQEQEHWAGLYLQNEGLLESLSEDMITNLAQAYQNGSKYEPVKAQTEEKPSKLAEAEANDAMAEAEEVAKSPEDAATKARELAYNRVYKDQEAGKAYAEGRRGENDSKMTRVEFAENERQNFEAKTTAKLRRVTLELAGLEAKDGMSAKEIFAEAKKAMTPEAAQKLDMYQKLSKALGLDMVIRDVVAGTSGYVHDGKLYVTLNGKQSMLRVAAHELTHYMKGHASEQYGALRTSLVNEVGQEKFDEMLADKAQEYGLDLNDAKARLEADDEVCAELCERMLENPDALERFVQSDLDAAKTLKQRLGKTLVAIKSAIRTLNISTDTKNDLIKQQETIEKWYKGLSDAIDNANKAGKTTATTEAETATVTDTTTEAPQAPPVETNPDLFMGEESARREQLRSDLEALAKKGTKVQDVTRQEVNDVLDRVILGDKSNYNKADYAQIRGMLAQLIPEVTAYVNGDESVDADALNERLNAAIDYMLDKYSEGSEDYYNLRDLIPNKIALTDTAYKDLRAKDLTLRQASNELTKALGGKFVNFIYKKAPSYNNAMTIDELWQTITDQYGEQNGVGNIGEDALALIDYVRERADNRTSFDDLYGSQREDMVNTQVGEFLDAVQSMVEGKTAKTEALHKLDDDYMGLVKQYENGDKNAERRLEKDIREAATIGGYTTPMLFHGTPKFGWTTYQDSRHDTPFIYTSTKPEVAAHYAGDQNYAFRRDIGKKYDGGDSLESIIEDARWVYETRFQKPTEQSKIARYSSDIDTASKIADRIDYLWGKVDYDTRTFPEEMDNVIHGMADVFYTIRDGDVTYGKTADEAARLLASDVEAQKELSENIAWSLRYLDRSREAFRNYYDEHRDEMSRDEKALFSYLMSYEVGDAAIDIEYGLAILLNNDRVLQRVADGGFVSADELRKGMDASHNIGAYKLYGDLGDNPFVFDANGGQFWALKVPEVSDGYTDTDAVSRWALANGYTSVVMKNIYDYGDKADNYVFFSPSQIKSADPVTYDDDGNVIPPSERFARSENDIRYSLDDDYMPLAERYDAGLATEAETKQLGKDVSQAAEEAGYTELWAHGTPSASFYSFDLRKARGAKAIFLSDLGVASQYASTTYRPISTASIGRQVETVDEALSEFRRIEDGFHQPRKTESGWTIPRSKYITTSGRNLSDAELIQSANELKEKRAGGVYSLFVRPGNKLTVDANGAWWDRIRSPYGTTTDQIGEWARTHGYDSVEIENVHDGGFNNAIPQNIMMVFNPNDVKSTDLVTYDKDGDIIPLSERFDPNKADIRWTVDDDLVQQYGAIEQGREPRARDVQVPRQSADNMRVSKFTRSIEESSKVTDAQAAEIASEIGSEADRVKQLWSYIPKSNDETMRKAKEFIAARQPATAQREFHDMVVAGKYGTRTAAIGLQLLSDASARDDWASVKDIAYDLRVLATEAGQSAQIFNVLKDLKGVGSAWYVEKLVNSLNSTYADEIASGQMDPITVSEEAMQKVREAKTQAEVDAAEKIVADEIGPQLPLKRDEKLSNWRYLSMLGNPVTHIRNVTGNNLMYGMGGIKDVVASGIQRIFESTGITDEGDRTYAYLSRADKAYWDKFAQESYNEQKRNLQGGGKLGFQSLVQQSKRSFDNKVLDAIARGKDPGTMSERKGLVGLLQNIRNNGAMGMLEVEDAWGLEKNYKRSLMEYMKAQGYSLNDEGKVGKVGKDGSFTEITNEQMNKAIEWATNQAWTNTFRGPSQLATELNKISKMNTASKLIVEGVMPFKKTPINIAKQGAMYSPAGIVIGTTELLTKVKQGKMSAATAIDHLSSGLTGTALMALGVVLAKAGILRGGGEDKKKLETYLEDTGDQTYAFKFGNVSVNMSAIAPATIPLFMGVALQEMLSRNGEDEGVDLSTITDVLAGTLNPFMEMSFMSSLNSALKNYNNEGIGGALGSTILTAAQNYGSQYLPTLGGKVAQFVDPTQRTTKSSATSPVGGNLDYYWRSLVKKVPGAEATLQPDVNVWGQTNTKDSFGDWALDFANKFILPTNIKVTNRDAVDNELIRVVESTGIADFLPSDGNKYFTVKGEKYKMNASQYTEYSKDRGQAAYAALKDVMAGASYKNATDEQKAELLKKALDNAYKQVNNVWKEKLGAYDK